MGTKRAKFVTIEGIEGCGKTTQIRRVSSAYRDRGLKVLATREPGGTALGNHLRDVLLREREEKLAPMAELFLMEAARAQHVACILQPALEEYELILCDRYTDATLAYQGGGRGLDLTWLAQLNQQATSGILPDRTLLLDMPIEASIERALNRNANTQSQEDRFEHEKIDFHRRVRDAYLHLARQEKDRFIVIDATRSFDEVTAAMTEAIDSLLPQNA